MALNMDEIFKAFEEINKKSKESGNSEPPLNEEQVKKILDAINNNSDAKNVFSNITFETNDKNSQELKDKLSEIFNQNFSTFKTETTTFKINGEDSSLEEVKDKLPDNFDLDSILKSTKKSSVNNAINSSTSIDNFSFEEPKKGLFQKIKEFFFGA